MFSSQENRPVLGLRKAGTPQFGPSSHVKIEPIPTLPVARSRSGDAVPPPLALPESANLFDTFKKMADKKSKYRYSKLSDAMISLFKHQAVLPDDELTKLLRNELGGVSLNKKYLFEESTEIKELATQFLTYFTSEPNNLKLIADELKIKSQVIIKRYLTNNLPMYFKEKLDNLAVELPLQKIIEKIQQGGFIVDLSDDELLYLVKKQVISPSCISFVLLENKSNNTSFCLVARSGDPKLEESRAIFSALETSIVAFNDSLNKKNSPKLFLQKYVNQQEHELIKQVDTVLSPGGSTTDQNRNYTKLCAEKYLMAVIAKLFREEPNLSIHSSVNVLLWKYAPQSKNTKKRDGGFERIAPCSDCKQNRLAALRKILMVKQLATYHATENNENKENNTPVPLRVNSIFPINPNTINNLSPIDDRVLHEFVSPKLSRGRSILTTA